MAFTWSHLLAGRRWGLLRMDIDRMIVESARLLVEGKHRREQECHIPYDLEADLALMANHIRETWKIMLATNVTIQLEPGMVLLW